MSARLSVIIPIYNVAPYIEECLTSVANQDFAELEVVLVDDGSTDDSSRLAEEFAARDSRFRLVRQANGGPGAGAARNAGLRHISQDTEYLAFVDSDDILGESAYSRLISTLDASGSDIATGNVYRFDSQKSYQFEKHTRDFGSHNPRVNILSVPGLLMDRTVWNKVYRRVFWDRQAIVFPEGTVYDDLAVTVPLYCLAGGIDIVPDIVYHWRIREGDDRSITQQRNVSTLLDRFNSIDFARAFLRERSEALSDHLEAYDKNLLAEEIPLFFDDYLEAGKEYRKSFTQKAAALLKAISPRLETSLPPALRNAYSSIRRGNTENLYETIKIIALDDGLRDQLVMSSRALTGRPRIIESPSSWPY